jgi:hypothetical protein
MASTLAAGLALSAALIGLSSSPAQAAPSTASVSPQTTTSGSQSYSKSVTWKSPRLGVCVIFTVSGKFTYTLTNWYTISKFPVEQWTWSKIQLNSPTLVASVHFYGGGSCIGPATVSSIYMVQHWSGYSCSYNPQISFGAGFPPSVSLGFAAWPTCGSKEQVAYYGNYGPGAAFYQYNDGSPASFADFTSGAKTSPPCYGAFVSAQAYQGTNTSDSYAAANINNTWQICI